MESSCSDWMLSTVLLEFGRCRTGWKEFGQYCYQFNLVKKSWSNARVSCVNQQADLVSIHSPVEQAHITLETGPYGLQSAAWIGKFFYCYSLWHSYGWLSLNNACLVSRQIYTSTQLSHHNQPSKNMFTKLCTRILRLGHVARNCFLEGISSYRFARRLVSVTWQDGVLDARLIRPGLWIGVLLFRCKFVHELLSCCSRQIPQWWEITVVVT